MYLVAPPAAGDAAGLALVEGNARQPAVDRGRDRKEHADGRAQRRVLEPVRLAISDISISLTTLRLPVELSEPGGERHGDR